MNHTRIIPTEMIYKIFNFGGIHMSLTIHEALDLKALERFKLVAGLNGLNNIITRVGLIDHEEGEQITDTVIAGEFLFSNLLLIKDQPEKILEFVKRFIQAEVSCFALKTIYFDGFPQEVIDYANKHRFPLFTFDETFIENIILDIDQALNIQSQIAKIQGYLDEMTILGTDELKVRTLALKLNRYFTNRFIACTIDTKDKQQGQKLMISTLNQVLGRKSLALEYNDSILILTSFNQHTTEKDSNTYMKDFVIDAIEACGFDLNKYQIGLSTPQSSLGRMGRAVLESRYALEYTQISQTSIKSFDELGVYQILIPNMENPWFYAYYEQIIQKLIGYDEKNDTDLLHTAIAYVDSDTNIQATSELLFQHVNTVRYRIKKIKELLNLNALDGMQYESLSLAIHLYKLHSR